MQLQVWHCFIRDVKTGLRYVNNDYDLFNGYHISIPVRPNDIFERNAGSLALQSMKRMILRHVSVSSSCTSDDCADNPSYSALHDGLTNSLAPVLCQQAPHLIAEISVKLTYVDLL